MAGETIAKISIGRVIGDTFAIVGRGWRTLGLIALVFIGLPGLVTALGMRTFAMTPVAIFSSGPTRLAFWGFMLISVIAQILAIASITQGALNDARGRASTIGELLGGAVRAFVPLLLLFIVVWFISTLGFILLIVPGIIILLRWSVAVQSCVDRNLGVGASLRRSVELTKGNRWRIFGFFFLVFVAISLISGVLVALSFGAGFRVGAVQPLPISFVSVAISIVQTLVLVAAGAALYLELDRAKGGAGSAAIADTFA